MNHSRKLLWQLRLRLIGRLAIFAVVIAVVVAILPRDIVSQAKGQWARFVQYMKDEHGPFYEFFSNKDMDKAMKEYEQFKGNNR